MVLTYVQKEYRIIELYNCMHSIGDKTRNVTGEELCLLSHI